MRLPALIILKSYILTVNRIHRIWKSGSYSGRKVFSRTLFIEAIYSDGHLEVSLANLKRRE